MGETVTEKLTQAAREWLSLHTRGEIANDEVYKNWLGVLCLERTFEGGSILRWSERMGGWRFYKNQAEFIRRARSE